MGFAQLQGAWKKNGGRDGSYDHDPTMTLSCLCCLFALPGDVGSAVSDLVFTGSGTLLERNKQSLSIGASGLSSRGSRGQFVITASYLAPLGG